MPDAVIVDLDGTIYRGETPIRGASDAIETIREDGLNVLFFSNNPTRRPEQYVEHLGAMGIRATAEEILTSGVVTTEYLLAEHGDDQLFVVGADALRAQFRRAGLTLTTDPAATDVLVGSWDRRFNYDAMQAALDAVDEETAFVGTDPDRTFPGEDGGEQPGSGAIISALAGTVGREPDAVLGKPSRHAARAALDRLGVAPDECLVVGDRLDTDVAMGDREGMTTALVLSGVSRREDLRISNVQPDHVLSDLSEIERVL
jgi:HAD superfamily hydrolase (TIGR01450 family)